MDAQQIEKVKKGNIKEIKALYLKYSPVIYLHCLKYMADQDEAKNLTHQVVFKIIQCIHTYKPDVNSSLKAWILKISTNECLMHIRKYKRLQFENNGHPQPLSINNTTADSQLVADDYLKLIRALPDGYRIVFNLHALEGYSHKEIADLLDISESTSRSQLTHARNILKEQINKYF